MFTKYFTINEKYFINFTIFYLQINKHQKKENILQKIFYFQTNKNKNSKGLHWKYKNTLTNWANFFIVLLPKKKKKKPRIGIEPSLLSGGLPPILQHRLGNSATLVHLTHSGAPTSYFFFLFRFYIFTRFSL